MKDLLFKGSGVAIVTPFRADMTVNYEELDRLIAFQLENGTDAIITCGTTGEAATLSHEEHLKVIDFTVKAVRGRVPVIAGTGSNDTMYSAALSKEAKALGADGLLLVTPYYNKTSQRGLAESFNYVANEVKMPCIVYNVPGRTSLNILPETYFELSKNPYIVATKEANHDTCALAKTIALCGDNLNIYSGEDVQTLPIIAMGGMGVISVFANIMPAEMHALATATLEGDLKTARNLTTKYVGVMNALFSDVNPIPVKAALNLMGYDCGSCRLPLVDMTDDALAALRRALEPHVTLA